MALVAVILGGVFGFANFLVALIVYDASFFAALGIYSLSGLLLACAMLALASIIKAVSPERATALSNAKPSTQQP